MINGDDMSDKPLKPLVKWSGGKSDEIKLFKEYFPEKYNRYIEPFIGGGSVYFYLRPENAIISDVHNELIVLYKSIANGGANEIYSFMSENFRCEVENDNEIMYYNIRDKMLMNCDLDLLSDFITSARLVFAE